MRGYVVLILLLGPIAASAQMVTGRDIPGFTVTMGLEANRAATAYKVDELTLRVSGQAGPNVVWPGEEAAVTFRFLNQTAKAIRTAGRFDVIQYGTKGRPGDFWTPDMFKIRQGAPVAFHLDLAPNGSQRITVTPRIPETFGGYALVADISGYGRAFAASIARVIKPDLGRVQFPTYALDETWPEMMNENVLVLFKKLGIKGARMGASFALDTLPDYPKRIKELERNLKWAQDNDVTAMLTVDNGSGPMPLGRPRPWLSADNHFLKTKDDRAWLPAYDDEFQKWVQRTVARWGWPRGPVNAVELWNEPWEGISISGWGADIPRYRALYERMALGVEAARRESGVQVLIGGTCSSTNTRDKLFPDGSNKFLKWLDFVSIHYQPMSADPALDRAWIQRKSPYGPVRVWDTESWIANSEDRVAAVIASMRSQGQGRTAGVYAGNVYESVDRKVDGTVFPVVQAWSPAAAIAATQKFIGQRKFRELLFRNGLPWIFLFNELASPDDGTAVVVGNLGGVYDKNLTLFRSVNLAPNAVMTVKAGPFSLYDFYGNRIEHTGTKVQVPLNGLGYFLRPGGATGSWERLVDALRSAEITGCDPVEILAHDFIARPDSGADLKLTFTNVLNRRVAGEVKAAVSSLVVSAPPQALELEPGETRDVIFRVRGPSRPDNIYALVATFRSPEGSAVHRENLHVNLIAHRTITVDGDLDDWKDILPETIAGEGIKPSETEQAYLPFKNFPAGTSPGLVTAYLAYDDRYFYFAAKIADSTPDPGMLRFANRDDDSFFYPEVAFDGATELTWPSGVRRFSYRKNFEIPSGNDKDNVQIAFNVLPESQKPLLPFPPGTMRHYMVYSDTDYEYALNPVAPEYGGGSEVWRLLAPGVPRKHFFPRQPKSPRDGGPVPQAQLVNRREGNTRIVEAAIPWAEIPAVRDRLLNHQTIRFTFRVNDNKGRALELAAGRSISKENAMTFHDDWNTHWSNEIEFAFEP